MSCKITYFLVIYTILFLIFNKKKQTINYFCIFTEVYGLFLCALKKNAQFWRMIF